MQTVENIIEIRFPSPLAKQIPIFIFKILRMVYVIKQIKRFRADWILPRESQPARYTY